MLTIPLPGGSTWTVIIVALFTVKHGVVGSVPQGFAVMELVPTVTAVAMGLPAASKSVPVSVTVLPPSGPPAFGVTWVTVGPGATYV
jgi:hypothetical protein